EDEPFVREATGILRHAGFEVLPAENAVQALQVYEECGERIDLVMRDMSLPGATGQQLTRDLRRHSPDLPALMTSGYSNQESDVEYPPGPRPRSTLLALHTTSASHTQHNWPDPVPACGRPREK